MEWLMEEIKMKDYDLVDLTCLVLGCFPLQFIE